MKTENCNDPHCPFHSGFKTHGRTMKGKVIKYNTAKTAQIEIPRLLYLPKFERYEHKRTRLNVHVPPCIKIKLGDIVTAVETRPISKTKNFVVTENESNKS
jgi:small subunit ribosomal protein S17